MVAETELLPQTFRCYYCKVPVAAKVANMNHRGQHCHYRCREKARKAYIEEYMGNTKMMLENPHEA